MLSDEQMSKGWPFSLINDEHMCNWLGVEHQPVISQKIHGANGIFYLNEWSILNNGFLVGPENRPKSKRRGSSSNHPGFQVRTVSFREGIFHD